MSTTSQKIPTSSGVRFSGEVRPAPPFSGGQPRRLAMLGAGGARFAAEWMYSVSDVLYRSGEGRLVVIG